MCKKKNRKKPKYEENRVSKQNEKPCIMEDQNATEKIDNKNVYEKEKMINQIAIKLAGKFKMTMKLEKDKYEAVKDEGTDQNIISKEIVLQKALPKFNIEKVQLKNIFGNIQWRKK
jgi:hypothetical protein